MTSKRSHEGYLLIDNRYTPGVEDDLIRSAPGPELPPGAGKGLFEAATLTCSHCQAMVILEPRRTRPRAYCTGCDHYICDRCGLVRSLNGGQCKTFKQLVEEVQESAALQAQRGSIILP